MNITLQTQLNSCLVMDSLVIFIKKAVGLNVTKHFVLEGYLAKAICFNTHLILF